VKKGFKKKIADEALSEQMLNMKRKNEHENPKECTFLHTGKITSSFFIFGNWSRVEGQGLPACVNMSMSKTSMRLSIPA
jgi:hypothetical protein